MIRHSYYFCRQKLPLQFWIPFSTAGLLCPNVVADLCLSLYVVRPVPCVSLPGNLLVFLGVLPLECWQCCLLFFFVDAFGILQLTVAVAPALGFSSFTRLVDSLADLPGRNIIVRFLSTLFFLCSKFQAAGSPCNKRNQCCRRIAIKLIMFYLFTFIY